MLFDVPSGDPRLDGPLQGARVPAGHASDRHVGQRRPLVHDGGGGRGVGGLDDGRRGRRRSPSRAAGERDGALLLGLPARSCFPFSTPFSPAYVPLFTPHGMLEVVRGFRISVASYTALMRNVSLLSDWPCGRRAVSLRVANSRDAIQRLRGPSVNKGRHRCRNPTSWEVPLSSSP